jgi:acetoin utilization protein AcuB
MVRAWMSSPAICADSSASIEDARRLMRDQQVRRLPVLDSSGALVGVITERDIERAVQANEGVSAGHTRRAATLPIGALMTSPAISVTPDTPILAAARLLVEHAISGMPVVEAGTVIGIITEHDLFRALLPQERETV